MPIFQELAVGILLIAVALFAMARLRRRAISTGVPPSATEDFWMQFVVCGLVMLGVAGGAMAIAAVLRSLA